MRCLPFILFLLLRGVSLTAQATSTVIGVVRDSTGRPVASASVTITAANGAGLFFTKSGADGRFECRVPTNTDSCAMKVAALGFATAMTSIPRTGEPLEIILRELPIALQEVTVPSKLTIRQTKDTLHYNVQSLRDKNDRVVADLIARLPGLQIDEKGAISYNGKNISSVYIDGDDLLGGRYSIATNNVPVEAVDQIQVIERDQPVKAMDGFVPADNVSLNLKLTANARTTMINTGHAGAGNKVFSGEVSNIIFQRKIKSINSIKTNNTGENLRAENADLHVSNGNHAPPVHQPYLSIAGDALPRVDEKYYLRNGDFAGSVNTLLSLPTGWKLRLTVATQQLKDISRYTNRFQYVLPGADTVAYDEVQNNVLRQRNWLVQAQLEKNTGSAYVRTITKAEVPRNMGSGLTMQNGQVMQQVLPFRQASFSNTTQILSLLGARNLLQYRSEIQYYSVSERLQIVPGIHPALLNDSLDYNSLSQQVHNRNFFIHQSLTYKAKWQRWVLSASAGGKYERNLLASELFKDDGHGQETPAGAPFANETEFRHAEAYVQGSMLYRFAKGFLSAEVLPSVYFIDYPQAGRTALRSGRYFTANPVLEFRNDAGKSGEFTVRYARETSFGQLQDVYPGVILVNYRQLSFNEAPLPIMRHSHAGIRYAYRKPLKMLFYNVSLSAGSTKQNFIRAYTIDRDLTRAIAMDFNNTARQYTASGYLSKYLFFLSANVSATLHASLQDGYTLYNGAVVPFTGSVLRGSATARRKLGKAVTMTVMGEKGWAAYRQENSAGSANRNITHSGKFKTEWQHHVHEKVSYKLAHHFIRYRQAQQTAVRNHFLECYVRIAPFRAKGYFELQGTNLLNSREYRQVTANAYQVTELLMPLRERMVLLKYQFNF